MATAAGPSEPIARIAKEVLTATASTAATTGVAVSRPA